MVNALATLSAVVEVVEVVEVEAFPFRVAVMVPALKSPDPSRKIIVLAVLLEVAVVDELAMLVIVLDEPLMVLPVSVCDPVSVATLESIEKVVPVKVKPVPAR